MRLLIPALLALTFVGCSCQRQGPDDKPADPPAPAATPAGDTSATSMAATLRAQEVERQRSESQLEAVNTLHEYLQQVGSGQREKAEKHWAYQRLPSGNEESDLRALKNLRGVRIENQAPKPLDSEPVPESLEIPVDLRVVLEDGESRRYKGWYRIRRNSVDRHWELTAVSIAATLK